MKVRERRISSEKRSGRRLGIERLDQRVLFAADLAPPVQTVEQPHGELICAEIRSLPACEGLAAMPLRSTTEPFASSEMEGAIRAEGESHRHEFDVNDDGVVDRDDSLRVIEYLNTVESTAESHPGVGNARLDVTGDGKVTPLDALRIINYVNSSEGESVHEVRPDCEYRYLPIAGPEEVHQESAGTGCQYDVDRSGFVDQADALRIIQHIDERGVGAATPATEALDTNQDGVITPLDVLAVINYWEINDAYFDIDSQWSGTADPFEPLDDLTASSWLR